MRLLCASCLLAVLPGGLTAASREPKAASTRASFDRYRILLERNVFSRERGRPKRRVPTTQRVTPPPKPVTVLRGILRRGDQYIAFFESSAGGRTSKVRTGDTVATGRVTRITLDFIEVEKDGKTAKVEVGASLEGGAPPPVATFAASGTPAAAPSPTRTTPTVNPGSPAASGKKMSILERLRQRRQKELQKKK